MIDADEVTFTINLKNSDVYENVDFPDDSDYADLNDFLDSEVGEDGVDDWEVVEKLLRDEFDGDLPEEIDDLIEDINESIARYTDYVPDTECFVSVIFA